MQPLYSLKKMFLALLPGLILVGFVVLTTSSLTPDPHRESPLSQECQQYWGERVCQDFQLTHYGQTAQGKVWEFQYPKTAPEISIHVFQQRLNSDPSLRLAQQIDPKPLFMAIHDEIQSMRPYGDRLSQWVLDDMSLALPDPNTTEKSANSEIPISIFWSHQAVDMNQKRVIALIPGQKERFIIDLRKQEPSGKTSLSSHLDVSTTMENSLNLLCRHFSLHLDASQLPSKPSSIQ